MDIKIKSAAFRLAKIFCDESEVPLRFKHTIKDNKATKVNIDSLIEKKFQNEINLWTAIITTMLSKIDKTLAWRFINLTPLIATGTKRVADCKDFYDINEYLVLRRDIENCDNNELGCLAWLSVVFQKEIEKKIQHIGQTDNIKVEENNLNFIAIDFETATSDRHSPCEIGLTFVENGRIIDSKSWLIKPFSYPHFDSFNIMIHGIQPKDVANKPEFPELWKEIRPIIENKLLIAHNAGFDFSVLRRTLEYYNIPFPNLQYTCSYIISKKTWLGLPGYDLKTLCQNLNINFNHHRAGEDSQACAELTLKAIEKINIKSFEELAEKLKITLGKLFPGGYTPSKTKQINHPSNLNFIVGDITKHNPESIFCDKTVVFTGTLSSMTRLEAQKIIADIGSINSNTITKETDFLIIGHQDFRFVGESGMSSKQKRAIELIEKGSKLEILSEEDFLHNI